MNEEIKKKKTALKIGVNNRRKGHTAERYYVNIFKKYFPKCITTRNGSRLLDNCKIDAMFLPLSVQIKAGKQMGMNPSLILKEMKTLLIQNLPEDSIELKYPKLIIHRKPSEEGKRTEFDELVTMTFKDFMQLIDKIYGDNKNK